MRAPGSKAKDGEDLQKLTPNRAQMSKQGRASPYPDVAEQRNCNTPRKSQTPDPEDNLPGSSSEARSALHLAQVDALIKELQRTRGLPKTLPPNAERTTQDRMKDDNRDAAIAARASSVPPEGASISLNAKVPWVWVAGHDGVLRPDMCMEGRPSSVPRLARSDVSSAFMPAGMQDLNDMSPGLESVSAAGHAHPMKRTTTPTPPWPIFQTGPTLNQFPKDSGLPFPDAFDRFSRSVNSQGTVGRNSGRSRSRNCSGQAPARSPGEETANWRSSKLPKDSKTVRPNPPSTAGPPVSPVQTSHWPTLDEICAKKSSLA
ncbi:uncharacterized protein PHACADRAFT_169797 [Phanerochaete carnosa HHB-10118-sp]|uniref:Uncharacterized protein n=1 Tax=Phanerochaete carnosa (strain HHB-10118-sp) TaxID=650164 RepID=K5W5S9_PHACS|nr:uncharacterized protein PHACADRAFT_169797 [Phanerochaete carnosa HHB-10118-sp]EKM59278.1 hypothetical protein PHACADRAFT_169797 [Phanerochaete carnosa HHB-10118-sp]